MLSHKKYIYLFVLAGVISILILQSAWIYRTYQLTYQQLMADIKEAFGLAHQKEQTYRIPVVDIVNPGAVTIQSCGSEEVIIVRKCPDPDTIVYNNVSGHSIESFINRVFSDLREHIVPLNIYCLADLFAGMLHDRNIPISFVIERFDINTGEVLETSLLPGRKQPEPDPRTIIVSEISDKEAVRANLQLTPAIVLGRMSGTLVSTACLSVIIFFSIGALYFSGHKKQDVVARPAIQPELSRDNAFRIGKYNFDPDKNELQGFGESIQLNKKENAILFSLCVQRGNVVERNVLLEENWGNSGLVYSRSLDTYLTTLRKYLKKDPSIQIVTVKGVGYKLVLTEVNSCQT